MRQHFKYFTVLFGSSMALCLIVLCINLFFDPLWYLNGNQLESVNYMFDERLSKTNQYVKRRSAQDYNCFIFGSSRATLLNESRLDAHYRCFNFSFSGGRIKEFVAFAKWLKNRGENPDYIILGIDDFNFVETSRELNIPDFIAHNSDPPSLLYSYFSLDALDMSFRLFFHMRNDPKIYDQSFLGTVVQDPPTYHPRLFTYQRTLRQNIVSEYKELRNVFPQSIFIGYIPPISSWITASKSQEEIDFLLRSIYAMSSFFQEIYDFSIPSAITSNPENTYDGSHYFPFIQKEIASALNKKSMKFGINVKGFSKEAYLHAYKDEVRKFQASLVER